MLLHVQRHSTKQIILLPRVHSSIQPMLCWWFLHPGLRKMSTSAVTDAALLGKVRSHLVPDFTRSHKGMAGRVGVVGGSEEYTGAPFLAAMSSLRAGCDLSHVFCQPAAAPAIKAYSPDLIVHPLLVPGNRQHVADNIGPWLPRLHSVVLGPGLGRDPAVLESVEHLIDLCREVKKPLVVDADGLWLASQRPQVFKDYPGPLVLTPNAPEYARLVEAVLGDKEGSLAAAFGNNTVVLRKGAQDTIEGAKGAKLMCSAQGSWRRCGGQGDLLSGFVGTFLGWETISSSQEYQPGVMAAYASCHLVRECNRRAFLNAGRSMVATDMLAEVHHSFEALFGQ